MSVEGSPRDFAELGVGGELHFDRIYGGRSISFDNQGGEESSEVDVLQEHDFDSHTRHHNPILQEKLRVLSGAVNGKDKQLIKYDQPVKSIDNVIAGVGEEAELDTGQDTEDILMAARGLKKKLIDRRDHNNQQHIDLLNSWIEDDPINYWVSPTSARGEGFAKLAGFYLTKAAVTPRVRDKSYIVPGLVVFDGNGIASKLKFTGDPYIGWSGYDLYAQKDQLIEFERSTRPSDR